MSTASRAIQQLLLSWKLRRLKARMQEKAAAAKRASSEAAQAERHRAALVALRDPAEAARIEQHADEIEAGRA